MSCTRRLTVLPPQSLTTHAGEINEIGSASVALSTYHPGFVLSTSLNSLAGRLYVLGGEQVMRGDEEQLGLVRAEPLCDIIKGGYKENFLASRDPTPDALPIPLEGLLFVGFGVTYLRIRMIFGLEMFTF